jgi:putative ABC transport system ATP-binding protein
LNVSIVPSRYFKVILKPMVNEYSTPNRNRNDSKNAHLIMDLLAALHEQGSTIVMVTHDPRFAERAERQISLFDGKIVEDRCLHAVAQ